MLHISHMKHSLVYNPSTGVVMAKAAAGRQLWRGHSRQLSMGMAGTSMSTSEQGSSL